MSSEDTDTDSAVMVEREDSPHLINEEDLEDDDPKALQIVSISDETGFAFCFHQDKIDEIIRRIPKEYKVSIVSVVGAFRTGKSFLLTWFLRYLSSNPQQQQQPNWYEHVDSLGNDAFEWKAGSERNTTGIWMWSHPHLVEDKQMAVLLVDTQGMFDHETTMALTASIFGFSTLLSSYQIYNVDKRIQEDHLQQLALFSEYARTAMDAKATEGKPFQKIEFLVRDWQHYEEDDSIEEMEASMATYLEKVLTERDAKDLKETREQIVSCFEDISCFGLCHPGFAVTKKKYTGDTSEIEKSFLLLLDRYCRRVFDNAQPKVIGGHELTAEDWAIYVKAYADLFTSGAKFPTAATILEATASANNTSAVQKGLDIYKNKMDKIAGPACTHYVNPEELKTEEAKVRKEAIKAFEDIATFGNKTSIVKAKDSLVDKLGSQWEVYESLNTSRNPLAGLEIYLLPLVIAVVSIVLRWIVDLTCSPFSDTCKAGSEALSHTIAIVISFLIILAFTRAKQIQDVFNRMSQAASILMETQSTSTKSKKD